MSSDTMTGDQMRERCKFPNCTLNADQDGYCEGHYMLELVKACKEEIAVKDAKIEELVKQIQELEIANKTLLGQLYNALKKSGDIIDIKKEVQNG